MKTWQNKEKEGYFSKLKDGVQGETKAPAMSVLVSTKVGDQTESMPLIAMVAIAGDTTHRLPNIASGCCDLYIPTILHLIDFKPVSWLYSAPPCTSVHIRHAHNIPRL